MAVSYTVEIKTNVSDPLRSLIFSEFSPIDCVMENGFQGSRMTTGEYIRYWFLDSTEVSRFADGETRDYNIEIVYYFDVRYYRSKQAFDEVYSDRLERLKRLLDNNSCYNDGTQRWHKITIETNPIQTVEELEGIEGEETIAQRLLVTITRNNFR